MDRNLLKQALIKRAAEAATPKKIDPKAAKGAVAGAVVGVLGERNYQGETNLRDAIRAARKTGVGEEKVERLVGAALVGRIAPKPSLSEDRPMTTEEGPKGLEGVLATKASQVLRERFLKSS